MGNEQVLTMEAGRVGDEDDPRPRSVPEHGEKLLPVAALYGANASGNSNLLAAIGFMREAVLSSHRRWPPEGGVPRDPFARGPKATEPSLFEVMFLVEGVRYQYGFVADDLRFVEEWLYAWPKGRKQTWIEREGDRFKFGEHLEGENRLVEQVTRPNALFLSTAAQHRHAQLMPIYQWFRDLRAIGLRGRHRRPRVRVRHASRETWLPLEEESQGTLTLINVGPVLLDALWSGGVAVIDELEVSLHPLLALQVVRQFNDPRTNPHNAQLLFTTHDTNLLGTVTGEPPLRRDQVWLTEKDKEGATCLYPLTDYKPRKAENIERGYLQGRYGAIPFLGELARVDG